MKGQARAALTLLLLFACVAGCRSKGQIAQESESRALPSVDEVVEAQFARAARLDRIWARAVVQLEYEDERGRKRSAQGEGHLQVIQPDRLALSVGKLGETLYWLGADHERHWAFELGDADRSLVGRHANIGSPCMQSIGAPVHPTDLLDVLGVRAYSDDIEVVGFAPDGTVEVRGPVHSGTRTLWLDFDTLLPRRVRISSIDPRLGDIEATLDDYEGVAQSDEGGFFPRMPARVIATHEASASRIQIDLSDMNDGARRGRLTDAAFTFETLVRALGPAEIIVLDASCPSPAIDEGSLAEAQR